MKRLNTMAGLVAAATPFVTVPVYGQAAPGGTSSVTVHGLVDTVVRRATNVSATGDADTTMEDGLITGSRLGFRGVEDLGDGLRAAVTLESGFDPSTGTSLQATPVADYGQEAASPRFWGREIHVALRNNRGGVTLGRQYTTAHQIAARFQPQGNPNNTALSAFSSHHIARQDNVVRLDTRLGDVELLATRTLGEQASSSSANASWSLGAGYTNGDLSLGGYVQQMNNRAGTEKRKIVGAGGNYKFNPIFALFIGYMQRSSEASPQENKVVAIGTNIELTPTTTASIEYFDDRQSGSAALEGSRKVGWVTANYRFSRRTDIYAFIDRNRVSGGYAKPAFMGTSGTQTALSLGLRHRF